MQMQSTNKMKAKDSVAADPPSSVNGGVPSGGTGASHRNSGGDGCNPDHDASVAANPTAGSDSDNNNSNNSNAPGGLLGYVISRKKTLLSRSSVVRNNSGSFYRSMESMFGDLGNDSMSDGGTGVNEGSSNDAAKAAASKSWPTSLQKNGNSSFPSLREASASDGANPPPGSSWLPSFQFTTGSDSPESATSDSWISQAWQAVDLARERMSAISPIAIASNKNVPHSSDGNDQRLTWMTTLSNTLASMSSLNPFSENTASLPNPQNSDTTMTSLPRSSAFLPNFASRFEWATGRGNPYQAVTGRDTDYLLYSPSLFSFSTWWLPWIITEHNHNHRLSINNTKHGKNNTYGSAAGEEGQLLKSGGIFQQSKGRKKNQPSEASVQAVKNLLMLVQQHLADAALQGENNSEHSTASYQRQEQQPHVQASAPFSPLTPMLQQQQRQGLEAPSSLVFSPSLGTESKSMSATPPSPPPSPSTSGPKPPTPTTTAVAVPMFPDLKGNVALNGNLHSSHSDFENHHYHNSNNCSNNDQAMHAEMAARLAEGTLRAYRDLALDEATELHSALHHWTVRWERPFLGWLEAGPPVWFSLEGYSPYSAGKKVSQIQAVLARRCAVIGEIQQHLWRANWQKGVAEWGMLGGGVGGEWTSVVGEFGGMEAPSSRPGCFGDNASSPSAKQQPHSPSRRKGKNERPTLMKIFNHSSFVGTNVSNSPGGSIIVDQEAHTTWSIDAMRVIRDQLYRAAGSGVRELPFVENWPREKRHFDGDEEEKGEGKIDTVAFASELDLPLWAREMPMLNDITTSSNDSPSKIIISDLENMSSEVSALLQSIEIHLEHQRLRRLGRLRPCSRLRRNWYLVAIGFPLGAYALYKLTKEHGGFYLLKMCFAKVGDIYKDHVSEPLESIYREIFTKSGRIDVTDRKARLDAIQSLKRMIRSWLEEYFPKMPLEEKMERAETMDISLIEERFEESIKHIYELNSVVRMSLIEMQFIKKELLSALVAMDELMGSNEINMRIAAMTPAVILLMAIRRGFQLLFYAFFQVGKSKEEIYSSFRQTILDIERLLVMRDNPPSPPSSFDHWKLTKPRNSNNSAETGQKSQTILSAEDLGMLLLHIHQCRNILWQSRRRFRSDVLRNVAEDLAELAGERGPVSVGQQLQIITRMARTYPFMKVVSSGIPFDMILPGA